MAYLVPNIPRIGITLQTLKRLGLELNPDILEELPKPKVKNPKKHQVLTYLNNTHASTAKLMYEQGLISKEDWKIMSGGKYGRRIEIDNVLAAAGAERFWKDFILASYRELFGTADYTMTLKIPSQIVVYEGDQITLNILGVNGRVHDVTVNGYVEPFELHRGELKTVTFTAHKAGTIDFICSIHQPTMHGQIMVLPRG